MTDLITEMNQPRVQRTPTLDRRMESSRLHTHALDLVSPALTGYPIFFVFAPIRIRAVATLVQGTNPSVTWNLSYSNDATNFNKLYITNQVANNTSTGLLSYPNVKLVPPGFWLWVETPTITGTVTLFNLTFLYEQ